jgi:hypothetical protein
MLRSIKDGAFEAAAPLPWNPSKWSAPALAQDKEQLLKVQHNADKTEKHGRAGKPVAVSIQASSVIA